MTLLLKLFEVPHAQIFGSQVKDCDVTIIFIIQFSSKLLPKLIVCYYQNITNENVVKLLEENCKLLQKYN